MKQKIKITILTLAVFLLFSCQIEEEVIKRDINLQNFKVEQKSYHELMQTIIFTKAISDLTNKSQTRNPKSEQQSKTIMETQYGFTILDSPVNITETNEIVSYTILIKSDSKIDVACFENLVMNVNKQSNILSAYLLKHKLAGTENQNNHPKSLIKSETTIKPIVFNNANYNSKIDTSCYTIFIPTCQKPWENYGEEDPYPYVEPHPLTAECLEDINYITVEELQICIDSFGPDDDTPNPINDSQNPNSNNNYGGSSNSSNVITAPVVPTYTSVNLTTELSLNQEQQDWINNPAQFKIKKELQQFLFADPFNDNLALEIIVRMSDPNSIFTNINPFLIEDQIDDSTLPPCPKAIVNKIKNLLQNDFAAIIAKLGGANVAYNVSIIPDPLVIDPNYATTNYVPNASGYVIPFQYQIGLNTTYLTSATQLSIASTLLHELVHAYFLSLRDDYINSGNTTLQTFPDLWNYYVVNYTGMGANLAQHTQMANNYVNVIACALEEMQTGICVPAGTQPLQIYQDLAWGGLESTPAYNIKTQIEKDRIQAINNAEIKNITQNNETGVPTYFPISTPCN